MGGGGGGLVYLFRLLKAWYESNHNRTEMSCDCDYLHLCRLQKDQLIACSSYSQCYQLVQLALHAQFISSQELVSYEFDLFSSWCVLKGINLYAYIFFILFVLALILNQS